VYCGMPGLYFASSSDPLLAHTFHLVYSSALARAWQREAHLRHVRNLSLIAARICLKKKGQNSPYSCSDEPTFNDLIEGSGWVVPQSQFSLH
jgi:hypothetical protein